MFFNFLAPKFKGNRYEMRKKAAAAATTADTLLAAFGLFHLYTTEQYKRKR